MFFFSQHFGGQNVPVLLRLTTILKLEWSQTSIPNGLLAPVVLIYKMICWPMKRIEPFSDQVKSLFDLKQACFSTWRTLMVCHHFFSGSIVASNSQAAAVRRTFGSKPVTSYRGAIRSSCGSQAAWDIIVRWRMKHQPRLEFLSGCFWISIFCQMSRHDLGGFSTSRHRFLSCMKSPGGIGQLVPWIPFHGCVFFFFFSIPFQMFAEKKKMFFFLFPHHQRKFRSSNFRPHWKLPLGLAASMFEQQRCFTAQIHDMRDFGG